MTSKERKEKEDFIEDVTESLLKKIKAGHGEEHCHLEVPERKFLHYLAQGAEANPDAAFTLGKLALTYKKSCEKIGQSIVVLFLTGMLIVFACAMVGIGPLSKLLNALGGK